MYKQDFPPRGGFAKKAGKHNREPREIVLDVLRATHGRVKIRGNVNRWSVIKLSKRLHALRATTHAIYTRAISRTQRCIVGEKGC